MELERRFRRFYERSDLPIAVRHGTSPTIDWKAPAGKYVVFLVSMVNRVNNIDMYIVYKTYS